jgi:acetyl esterase
MPLHPQALTVLKVFEAQPKVDFTRISAAEFRVASALAPPNKPGDPLERIEDRFIDGPGGPLRLRLYVPQGAGPWPVTLYFFGGGFVVRNVEITDHICRALARRANTLVVWVDHRLAPEAPFPAAVEDACAALSWVSQYAADCGGDAQRLAVAGDSAGGNLAAVAAQWARDEGIALRHQLLIYPPTDAAGNTVSYRELGQDYGFTSTWMDWYWRQYLPMAAMYDDVRASPLRQRNLHGLADATVFTAEYDLLRDEAEAYAHALQEAGVGVVLKRWAGQLHGFLQLSDAIDDADVALNEAALALRRAFA